MHLSTLGFEERCELATRYLTSNLADYKSADTSTPAHILELLSPKPEDSPAIREFKAQMLEEDAAARKEFEEKLTDMAWKSCIAFSNVLHGEDATAFAVAAIKRASNKSAN